MFQAMMKLDTDNMFELKYITGYTRTVCKNCKGKTGYIIDTYKLYYKDGELIEKKHITTSRYKKIDKTVRQGPDLSEDPANPDEPMVEPGAPDNPTAAVPDMPPVTPDTPVVTEPTVPVTDIPSEA